MVVGIVNTTLNKFFLDLTSTLFEIEFGSLVKKHLKQFLRAKYFHPVVWRTTLQLHNDTTVYDNIRKLNPFFTINEIYHIPQVVSRWWDPNSPNLDHRCLALLTRHVISTEPPYKLHQKSWHHVQSGSFKLFFFTNPQGDSLLDSREGPTCVSVVVVVFYIDLYYNTRVEISKEKKSGNGTWQQHFFLFFFSYMCAKLENDRLGACII